MKITVIVALTLCLCISAIMARPEPDFSFESFGSGERFGGFGHRDFSAEDLFDRRGGKLVLCINKLEAFIKKKILLLIGYYGNNYGNYGGYYQPYNPYG